MNTSMNGQTVSLSLVFVVRDIARRSHLKAFLMSGDVNNNVKKAYRTRGCEAT